MVGGFKCCCVTLHSTPTSTHLWTFALCNFALHHLFNSSQSATRGFVKAEGRFPHFCFKYSGDFTQTSGSDPHPNSMAGIRKQMQVIIYKCVIFCYHRTLDVYAACSHFQGWRPQDFSAKQHRIKHSFFFFQIATAKSWYCWCNMTVVSKSPCSASIKHISQYGVAELRIFSINSRMISSLVIDRPPVKPPLYGVSLRAGAVFHI